VTNFQVSIPIGENFPTRKKKIEIILKSCWQKEVWTFLIPKTVYTNVYQAFLESDIFWNCM